MAIIIASLVMLIGKCHLRIAFFESILLGTTPCLHHLVNMDHFFVGREPIGIYINIELMLDVFSLIVHGVCPCMLDVFSFFLLFLRHQISDILDLGKLWI